MNPVYVFDNDGTLNVPAPGSEDAFFASYVSGFASQLDVREELVAARFAALRRTINEHPEDFSWEKSGHAVAPANVDVCVMADVIAQLILRVRGADMKEWMPRLFDLYQANYLKAVTVWRTEMLEALNSLRTHGIPFHVVTNADPVKVRTRFAALGETGNWIQPLVYGHAKKYLVTQGPEAVEAETRFIGLDRPVHLRKQHYYDVLAGILSLHQASWQDLIVVGDIAELDLAMPVALGARGRLILGPNTPAYERDWADWQGWQGRVRTVRNLFEAIA